MSILPQSAQPAKTFRRDDAAGQHARWSWLRSLLARLVGGDPLRSIPATGDGRIVALLDRLEAAHEGYITATAAFMAATDDRSLNATADQQKVAEDEFRVADRAVVDLVLARTTGEFPQSFNWHHAVHPIRVLRVADRLVALVADSDYNDTENGPRSPAEVPEWCRAVIVRL